jgi:uncharacterized membrane protein (DUF2068 family)
MEAKTRPTGVTIIAILNIIGGIIMVIAGLALIAVSAVFSSLSLSTQQNINSSVPSAFFGVAGSALGAGIIALGIISFVVAYGLMKGKEWAWTLTVILSIISIALNVISIVSGNTGGIASIIISGVILYYLYRPHVKVYFGKAAKS